MQEARGFIDDSEAAKSDRYLARRAVVPKNTKPT
jgi:hypothetical protein